WALFSRPWNVWCGEHPLAKDETWRENHHQEPLLISTDSGAPSYRPELDPMPPVIVPRVVPDDPGEWQVEAAQGDEVRDRPTMRTSAARFGEERPDRDHGSAQDHEGRGESGIEEGQGDDRHRGHHPPHREP